MLEEMEAYSNTDLLLLGNMSVYESISKNNESFLGRKAQQRRIRESLRLLSQQNPGILGAWEEIWQRWKMLSQNDLDDYEGLMSNSDPSTSRLSRGVEKKVASPSLGRQSRPYQYMTLEERAFQWQVGVVKRKQCWLMRGKAKPNILFCIELHWFLGGCGWMSLNDFAKR